MNNLFWKRTDNVIIGLNKMESLLSLILIFTGTAGLSTMKDFWIKSSFYIILGLGLVTILLISLYLWRRVNDQSFIRSFYINEGKNIKKEFNRTHRINFLNSGYPESKYIEMEKEEIVFNILLLRQNYSFKYVKNILDDIYNEFNRDNK